MQLLRKLIILSAVNNIGNGVIKLEAIGDKVKGVITIFEPKGMELRLGIRVGYSRLYEYELNSSNYEFRLDDGMDMSNRIECIVADNKSLNPILIGSSDGRLVNIDKLLSMFTQEQTEELFQETSETVPVTLVNEITVNVNQIEDNIVKEDKLNNEYKINEEKIILDEKIIIEDNPVENVNKEIENKNDNIIDKIIDVEINPKKEVNIEHKPDKDMNMEDFFNGIKPQLDELFKCYPADKELMRSVPDSKWVRVNYESDEYYVVGIMYNGKRATHICYGVPGVYTIRPKQKSEWLPLDYADPEGKGYWVIFQDAITGNTI